MTNKKNCVVCGFRGDGDISYHRFPDDEQQAKAWALRIPLVKWKRTKEARLCSDHFLETDFKTEKEDSNKWRKGDKKLKRRTLKPGALPSIWPTSTKLPEKSTPRPRDSRLSLPSCRTGILEQKLFKQDVLHTLEDIKTSAFNLPPGVVKIINTSSVTFAQINTVNMPIVQYAVKVNTQLDYEIFWLNRILSMEELFGNDRFLCERKKMSSLSFCNDIFHRLESMTYLKIIWRFLYTFDQLKSPFCGLSLFCLIFGHKKP